MVEKVFTEIKKFFDTFIQDNAKYQELIQDINKSFKYSNEVKLLEEHPPTFFSGDITSENKKIVVIGLNPGYNEILNEWEKNQKIKSWFSYFDFCNNFFTKYKEYYEEKNKGNKGKKIKNPMWDFSRYYYHLAKVLSTLKNLNFDEIKYQLFDFYQRNVVNIDLLPFHSKSFGGLKYLKKNKEVLYKYWENSQRIIENINVEIIIFNGKQQIKYVENVIGKSTENMKKIRVGEMDFNLYFFKLLNNNAVIIDKFLSRNNKTQDLLVNIPQVIKEEYKI